ncbi:hypothetical protein ACFWRG_31375 [Micromonospora tulbaghiae]|uniref:hypothetical protein n=1 Tax=Micromonospora tulbaghiae TaxID=479978 RepID=UPI003656EA38
MSMLLLIRSVDHTEAAIRQASDYLAHHRRQFTDPHHRDTLLGIWIRPELDADLPASIPCGPSAQICGCTVDEPSRRHPTEAPLGIRTSSSLSGLWSLCWLDGPVLRQAHSPQQRRHRILDTLVKDAAPQASRPGAFFPVFDPADSSDIVDQRLAELRSRPSSRRTGSSMTPSVALPDHAGRQKPHAGSNAAPPGPAPRAAVILGPGPAEPPPRTARNCIHPYEGLCIRHWPRGA